MPSTVGSVQDNKKRALQAQFPAVVGSVSDLWRLQLKSYLAGQAVPIPAQATNDDLEHAFYAQHCVGSAVFPNYAATRGYSVNDLRKRWLTAVVASPAGKSVNDLELAYWRSL